MSALCNYFSFITAADDFALLSNRSNLHHKMGRFEEALQDATEVIRLKPDWPKVNFNGPEFCSVLCNVGVISTGSLPQGCGSQEFRKK